jgi:4-cresol dehydrogenase (hydroxylating)
LAAIHADREASAGYDGGGRMRTPQGVSETAVMGAIEGLEAALGKGRVLVDGEEFEEFRDPYQPQSWDSYLPSAVVLPESTEEVQAVVRIANEHGVPIWTHGVGRNNGYGGAAPGYGGSITVSLRNMKRVTEINEELAYVEVEPGVTWCDLYETLTAGGHRLMVSNTDIGWGSVVGNTLEHGVTYGPMGSDYTAPCGLEVVTATGEVLRTGMGAMSGNAAWHTYKRSFGPSIDTLFMQSNMGIVTKMGLWMLPAPEVFMPVWARLWNEDDLEPAIDVLRGLRLERTIEGVPGLFNTLLLASAFERRRTFYEGEGPIPDEIIDEIGRKLEIGRWLMRAGLYGHEAQVDMQFERIKAAFATIPGADVWGSKVAFDDIPKLENQGELVIGGVPNIAGNFMTGWYSETDGAHLDFSPVIPLVGRDVMRCHKLMRTTLEQEAGLDLMVGSCVVNPRTTIHVGMITYDRADEQVTRQIHTTISDLIRTTADAGFPEYRAHIKHMDEIAGQYDFNDHVYRRFMERIKDAVDPNGILSPGKQGIWPERFREAGGAGSPDGT